MSLRVRKVRLTGATRPRADNLTKQQRSHNMSRIRSTGTVLERAMEIELRQLGLQFETHAPDLPGKPDFVFREEKLAVFLDGDFWHGWRFSRWKSGLSPYWQAKIERNRARDKRNFRKLRKQSWKVIRIWEHQMAADAKQCADRINASLRLERHSSQE